MHSKEAHPVHEKDIRRLSELKKGQSGRIIVVSGGKQICNRLTDMGLTPGTKVRLNRASSTMGALEICIRSSCLAVGRGVADKILVKVEK